MARSLAGRLVTVAVLAYGLYSFLLYGLMAVVKGTFFRRPTEQESLELQLGTPEAHVFRYMTIEKRLGNHQN